MSDNQGKGQFNSNFGFLMATVGSAIGLGNLWGFPYKMGVGGGFAFLLIYLILAFLVGYPLILGEMALGRKTRKGAIEAYKMADKRFTFNGVIETLVPFFLICFYCTFGGYVFKYLVANVGDLLHAGFGIGGESSGAYFENFVKAGWEPIIYGWIFLGLTLYIVARGVSGGIEKFSSWAMPALFIMLVIIVIRSCTLPGAASGLAFMFKPDFSVFKGKGWLSVLGLAGGQMFFSLSLASGCIIAYGSYLDRKENLEKNAKIVPIADTTAALLAGLAVMPAVFAYGLEPASGPGLLFVTMQEVFQHMGVSGAIFGSLFYLLVAFAALTSSIGMLEGGVSAMLDAAESKGHKADEKSRIKMTFIMGAIAFLGSWLISADGLGMTGMWHPLGQGTWLDVFDLFAEGILMPFGGLIMAILLGWFIPDYIDDEVEKGSPYKGKKFIKFCLRWISPIFLAFIVVIQLNAFFHFFG